MNIKDLDLDKTLVHERPDWDNISFIALHANPIWWKTFED